MVVLKGPGQFPVCVSIPFSLLSSPPTPHRSCCEMGSSSWMGGPFSLESPPLPLLPLPLCLFCLFPHHQRPPFPGSSLNRSSPKAPPTLPSLFLLSLLPLFLREHISPPDQTETRPGIFRTPARPGHTYCCHKFLRGFSWNISQYVTPLRC